MSNTAKTIGLIKALADVSELKNAIQAKADQSEVSALNQSINVLKPEASASDVGKALIVKTVADGVPTSYEYGEAGSIDPQDIADAVNDWLDDHPEATTTVEDGSISYAKLDSELQGSVDDSSEISNAMKQLFNYTEGEKVTLVNKDSLDNIVNKYAATLVSYTDGVKTFTFGNGSQTNPAISHSSMSAGSDTWLVGFKYRLTKLDQTVSDPTDVRVLLGSSTAFTNSDYSYNEWIEFCEEYTGNLTQVYIAVRGFNPAPGSSKFQIEIKDYYVYDISDLDSDMIAYVKSKQSTSYADGTVDYVIDSVYAPDQTLDEEGMAADSKAVGNAMSLITQGLQATMQNKVSISNMNAGNGMSKNSSEANLLVFIPSNSPNVSPSIRDTCSLGTKKWLIGFKYKLTKLDPSVGDPECIRLYIDDYNLIDYTVTYGSWVEVSEIMDVNLTQVYIALRNYSTAPTAGQIRLEFKDYFVYDISSVDPDLIFEIRNKQSTNYTDGTVTYSAKVFSESLRSSLDIINVKNYGVVGDGTTDDTVAIRKLLTTKKGHFYFPAGTYRITGTIEIPENSILSGDGNGTVIDMHSCDTLKNCLFNQSGNWRVYPYILVQSDNVKIQKIKLIGNNSLQEKRHAAICIMDAKYCSVEDVTIYNINFDPNQDFDADVSGYGVCVNRSQFVNVERVNAQRCGYECIGIVFECNHCTVRDCYTQDGWRTCIQVHRASCNTTVENCYMKQTHTKYDACFTVHGLGNDDMVRNLRVENCTMECTEDGAQPNDYNAPAQIMSYCDSLVFIGNRVLGGKRAFYITTSSNNAKIIGNDFHCNENSDYGITIKSPSSIVIGNCLVNEASTPVNVIENNPIIMGNIGIS